MHPPLSESLPTAVLLLVFNRPEPTRHVLDALRQVRPARLYVAADGPRSTHPLDALRCQQVRELVQEAVDWPCTLHTLFRTTNLNCGVGPASAIDWFFRQEEEGIILEDDCVPSPEFFPFCAELLARYRHDTRVMHIGGNNFERAARRAQPAGAESYYFSGQINSWGWATWRRAWQHFDFSLQLWPELRQRGLLSRLYPTALERRYWLPRFAALHGATTPPDIWDYQWHFAVAAHSGLAIVPAVNLVRNVGFGTDATHTFHAADAHADVPTHALTWPLVHPPCVLRNSPRDQRRFREFMLERVSGKAKQLWQRLSGGRPAPAPSPTAPLPAPAPTLDLVHS